MTSTCRTDPQRAPARGGRWLPGLLALGALPPLAASAQTALDEVIVTARKMTESVQDIPMSVQVLSAELLDAVDLTRLFELQFNIPGLVVNNLGLNGAGFSLRGVADQGGSSLSVATHLNGVYLGTSNLAIARMFDLERVEVLKGPQGTLYGRNATGGSMNFHTRAATDEFSADLEAAYGSFDTTRLQGHLNLPLEGGGLRLAFIGSEGDGFIRNSIDNRKFAENDFWALRGSLLLNMSERLRVSLVAQRVLDDGASGELWMPQPDFIADPKDIRLTTVTLANPFLITKNDFVSINVDYDLGAATLHAITGYARSKIRDLDDCSGLPQLRDCVRGVLPSRHEQWSQELQLVSQGGGTVDWIVGTYYYDDAAGNNFFLFTPLLNPVPSIDRSSASDETTKAVYTQATWHLAERWRLTSGLRMNHEQHRLSTIGTGTEDSSTLIAARLKGSKLSWRLDLQRDLSDDLLLYAGVSTGFKSGGITILPGGVLDKFGAEELTAYEVGIKSQWLDRRMTLNAAAFFDDFRDVQVSTATATPTGFLFETDNAAAAEIYGIDADGLFHFAERLSVSAGVVWLPKRDFVEYRNDRTGDVLSGNRLTRAPEWTVAAAINYEHPLPKAGQLSARLEYNYRSAYFYTVQNVAQFAQDGFGLLNLFLTFETDSEQWYMFASGRNLGNADYFNQVFIQSSPGYPRTFEAGFGYRF